MEHGLLHHSVYIYMYILYMAEWCIDTGLLHHSVYIIHGRLMHWYWTIASFCIYIHVYIIHGRMMHWYWTIASLCIYIYMYILYMAEWCIDTGLLHHSVYIYTCIYYTWQNDALILDYCITLYIYIHVYIIHGRMMHWYWTIASFCIYIYMYILYMAEWCIDTGLLHHSIHGQNDAMVIWVTELFEPPLVIHGQVHAWWLLLPERAIKETSWRKSFIV